VSLVALGAAGAAVAAAWVAVSGRSTAARRLAAREPLAGRRGELIARRWPLPLLAGAAAFLLLGPVAAVLAAATALAGRRALREVRTAAERDRAAAAAAGACAVLAAELRAGRPQETALLLAAEDLPPPLAESIRRAVVLARLGGDVSASLRSAGAPPASAAAALLLRQLATCWQVAGRTGAGLAGVVDALATDLRARERLRLETNAALAGSRTTAWLLAGLPVVGIAMAAGFGAAPATVLLRTPSGLGCLFAGIALDVAGVAWTRRLVRRALDPR